MNKIVVDVAALQSLSSSLSSVASDFDSANASADSIAGAVGHESLAGTVRSFAHGWDDRRHKIGEAMRALSTASSEVAAAWIQIDQDGAAALTPEESAPGGGVPK